METRLKHKDLAAVIAGLRELQGFDAGTNLVQRHWCHGMKDKAQLSWVFGVAWATMVKPGSLGFAEDSLSRKMAWPCD